MTNINIEKSPTLRTALGLPIMQQLEAEAGRQYIAWINNVQATLGTGVHLTLTEGGRTYARQQQLYNGWVNRLPGYNLAAVPGTSIHERYRAADIGVGTRSLTPAEHAALVAAAPAYGWRWTGAGFSPQEWWHFEYVGSPKFVAKVGIKLVTAPVSNAAKAAAAAKKVAAARAAAAAKKAAAAKLAAMKRSNDMGLYVQSEVTGSYYVERVGGIIERINDSWGKRKEKAARGYAPPVLSGKAVNELIDTAAAARAKFLTQIAAAVGNSDISDQLAAIKSDTEALLQGESDTPAADGAEA